MHIAIRISRAIAALWLAALFGVRAVLAWTSERVAAWVGVEVTVALRGRLVEAIAPNGMQIRSSLRRDDTGGGACEVIWVEDLEVLR